VTRLISNAEGRMMNEEEAATDFVRFVSFLHSAFFLLHFAFRMNLLTSLRTRCYDPAGVGCYFFSGLLTDISSGTKLSGGCGRARLPISPVCREVTVRADVHPPGFNKFSV
jgi:hypothetical protein